MLLHVIVCMLVAVRAYLHSGRQLAGASRPGGPSWRAWAMHGCALSPRLALALLCGLACIVCVCVCACGVPHTYCAALILHGVRVWGVVHVGCCAGVPAQCASACWRLICAVLMPCWLHLSFLIACAGRPHCSARPLRD